MKQRQTILFALLAAIGLVAIGARRVASQHERVRLGYELTRARAELRAAEEETSRLRLEHSVLVSPERIRPLATALGMKQAQPSQIRVIDRSGGVLPKAARREQTEEASP